MKKELKNRLIKNNTEFQERLEYLIRDITMIEQDITHIEQDLVNLGREFDEIRESIKTDSKLPSGNNTNVEEK